MKKSSHAQARSRQPVRIVGPTGGLPAPNYTQIPNALLAALPLMSEAEVRVTLAIARQTFGWHKQADRLSLTQLQNLTGMGRQGVINGINAGIARGTIVRVPVEQNDTAARPVKGYYYRLVVLPPEPAPDEAAPDSGDPASPQSGLPERAASPLRGLALVHEKDQQVVHEVDTQKKIEKEIPKKSVPPPPPPSPSQPGAQNGGGGDVQDQKNNFPPGPPPQEIPSFPSAAEQLRAIGFQSAQASELLASLKQRPDADLVVARIIECARIEHRAGIVRSLTGVVHYRLSNFDAAAPPETPETVLAAIAAARNSAQPPGAEGRWRRRTQVETASPVVRALEASQYQRTAEQRRAQQKARQEAPRKPQENAPRRSPEAIRHEAPREQAGDNLEAHWYDIGASLWYIANRVPLSQRTACSAADARKWFDLLIAYRRANGLGPDAHVTVQQLQQWQQAAA